MARLQLLSSGLSMFLIADIIIHIWTSVQLLYLTSSLFWNVEVGGVGTRCWLVGIALFMLVGLGHQN